MSMYLFIQSTRVQLNAVVSRFPLELTFPVGLLAYSIFENVIGKPKAQLVHGKLHCYLLLLWINVLLERIFVQQVDQIAHACKKTKYNSCIVLYANIGWEYRGVSCNKARAFVRK